MDEETLNAFATKIAVHCQKTARGIKARDKAQIKRWERANIAAYRIQAAFRNWRMLQFTRKRYKKISKKPTEKGQTSWEKVMTNKASHDEKMSAWRNVIELRRAYSEYTTEVCIKALLHTNGDLSSALPLLGGRDFGYQARYGPPLGENVKESMNPYSKVYLAEDSMERLIRNPRSIASHSRRAHRHLQESLNTGALFTRAAYDLENVVMQSYFCKTCVTQPKSGKSPKGKKRVLK
eukprot:CAMPEP_0185039142 /NCGR_PEP_ID=MMETSP1103-20130426/35683_1 /TAXON_ID=36769 /ORGANISM="Paraphysomonas bandaiensis, Strain Caron Lab Isolate" /LENGTH=235 /DNA_ID=CAMNT_0027577913 /DNA_START=54 /DNA_END=761 /DNA_ORIENTATION=+